MTLYLLDVAPISSWQHQHKDLIRIQEEQERATQQAEQKAEEKSQKMQGKARKKAEQAKKKAEKARQKAEKAKKQAEKAQKKAEKAQKEADKAEKEAVKAQKELEQYVQPGAKDLSQASAWTVATVQVPDGQACEKAAATMPTGVVLAVCASLMVCCGSAWLYRRFQSGTVVV